MFSYMQSVLGVAITFSVVVFVFAALADGRGLQLLRMIVNATAPHPDSTRSRASAMMSDVKANIVATRSHLTSYSSPTVTPARPKVAATATLRRDTREDEMTREKSAA